MCKVYTELREKDKEYDEEVKNNNKGRVAEKPQKPLIEELN